ncbi:MAG TPA: hypothetical protein VE975_07010 [Actinomycetota bacterium]|nr:hypothetical protein [Actinomycetota bacterium]
MLDLVAARQLAEDVTKEAMTSGANPPQDLRRPVAQSAVRRGLARGLRRLADLLDVPVPEPGREA